MDRANPLFIRAIRGEFLYLKFLRRKNRKRTDNSTNHADVVQNSLFSFLRYGSGLTFVSTDRQECLSYRSKTAISLLRRAVPDRGPEMAVRVYLDTSVVLRVLFKEPHPYPGWGQWTEAHTSRIWHTKILRVLDRIRLTTFIRRRKRPAEKHH